MRCSFKLVWAMLAVVGRCGACSVAYGTIPVGPDFRVKVENQGQPVANLPVELDSSSGSGARTVTNTDKQGVAFFRGLRPGYYFVRANRDVGVPDGASLEVKRNGPIDVVVPLRWPTIAPISARSLKGTIRGPDYLPGKAQPRLSLDLLNARSGKVMKTFETNERGEFSTEGVIPGIYYLSLQPSGLKDWGGEPITGLLSIALDRDAPADGLDLDLGWSSCGLSYTDRSKCPQGEVQAEELSGRVVDSGEGAIGGAKIVLFDSAGAMVEQLKSDEGGAFAAARTVTGTYELLVTSPGFTPYRQTLRLEPLAEPAPGSSLTVQLGMFGTCSTGDLRQ